MKINRDNIDEYYEKINKKIDQYFGKGISPMALQRYFKKGGYGINRFLEREELSDVDGIDRVIHDCIEDRLAMDESGILTYEKFSDGDHKAFKVTFDVDIEIEKTLADLYKVSLGHIEHLDGMGQVKSDLKTNHIKVEGVGLNKVLYVFDTDAQQNLLLQMANYMLNQLQKEKLSNTSLGIELDLRDNLIDNHKFVNNTYFKLSKNKSKYIENLLTVSTGDEYIFKMEKNRVMVFEKMS